MSGRAAPERREHPRGATKGQLDAWRGRTRHTYGVSPEFYGLSDCSHGPPTEHEHAWPSPACSRECVAAQLAGVRRWVRGELGTVRFTSVDEIRAAQGAHEESASDRRAAAAHIAQAIECLQDSPGGADENAAAVRALGVVLAELDCAAVRHAHQPPPYRGRPPSRFADLVELLRDTMQLANGRAVGTKEAVWFLYEDVRGTHLEVNTFLENELQRARRQSGRRTKA